MNAAILLAMASLAAPAAEPLEVPGGAGGIGFDDLRYAPELRRVLVPAGRSGRLDLVDPGTRAVESIPGFTASPPGARGHSEGTTSADAGGGLLFATDRTRGTVEVVDPERKVIVAEARLGGGPDYVRWVAPLDELWVTEPDEKVIERFRVERGARAKLVRVGTIAVPDGPESLEIDVAGRRAYTNTWHDTTIAIDLEARAVAARWTNGCKGARGLAVAPARGLVFVGCAEGAVVALDARHAGKPVGRAPTGRGVDVIAFAAKLSHLYVPGAESATLTIVGVGAAGDLQVLGTIPTAPGAHCVTADESGHAYVCDPGAGRLLVVGDPYPAMRPQ